jgi:hypothetical protein
MILDFGVDVFVTEDGAQSVELLIPDGPRRYTVLDLSEFVSAKDGKSVVDVLNEQYAEQMAAMLEIKATELYAENAITNYLMDGGK